MSYVFIINDSFGEVELHPKLDLIEVKDFMGETHHNLYIGFDYYEDGAKLPYADFTVSFGEYIGMKNCAYVDTNNCRFADAILKTVEMSRYVQSKNPLNLKYTQYRICFSELSVAKRGKTDSRAAVRLRFSESVRKSLEIINLL